LKHKDAGHILADPDRLGRGESLEFAVGDQSFRLFTPSADEFFGRLASEIPFALPRLPHGFWDSLTVLHDARDRIAEAVPPGLFSARQLDLLAGRVCDELMGYQGVYAENFLSEILDGLTREVPRPDYLRSVSFKWQPTGDERLFGRTEAIGPSETQ